MILIAQRTTRPVLTLIAALLPVLSQADSVTRIPDTGQNRCYNDSRAIQCPEAGTEFFGQDAQYAGNAPAYSDNHDGTVTDLNTGLIWSKAVSSHKLSLTEAQEEARKMHLAGFTDWRVPNIKELYSLIDFRGYTGFSGRKTSGIEETIPANAVPFINTDYFDFLYGAADERYIDAQWLTRTRYTSTTMDNMDTLFGVNFADGRIKGYGYQPAGTQHPRKRFYVRYVRGQTYGDNNFVDNGNNTITDISTGLTWAKTDSGRGMTWKEALKYAAQLNLGGHSDWRLPNAKELQYIVDYNRAPDSTGSAAIDPLFESTPITNEKGERDYPAYWTSTTHLDGPRPGDHAAYISFGRAMGQIHNEIMDVHGAGAQRSDPKTGQAEMGQGPQGDAVRVYNYVRVVRGGSATQTQPSTQISRNRYPYNINLNNFSVQASIDSARQMQNDRQPPPLSDQDFSSHFVKRLDHDHDNRVSRQEFDGPPDRFDVHDKNHDGYLSADEAPPPPPMLRRRQ
ncbi:Lcl domain-containing protein [Amphritea pacifica]|uniref:DUF1566 domain-containing protein n=1 Tax=Amphritea pacifica TaxID=2811233 RepID=A0ABS2WAL4_9GAMM|nr:DUF1566 domain-containing protein [Amphritea pacifica]MBN0988719.1 DUF1566 domain-containing protein [Amphritea pacifica]